MENKVNELLNEGGKVVDRSDNFCIVEKDGRFYHVDESGNVQIQHIICD